MELRVSRDVRRPLKLLELRLIKHRASIFGGSERRKFLGIFTPFQRGFRSSYRAETKSFSKN